VAPPSQGFAVDALGKNAIVLSESGDLTLAALDGTTQTFVDHPVDLTARATPSRRRDPQ
jgi:hypothetical protein